MQLAPPDFVEMMKDLYRARAFVARERFGLEDEIAIVQVVKIHGGIRHSGASLS